MRPTWTIAVSLAGGWRTTATPMRNGTLLRRMRRVASTGGVTGAAFSGVGSTLVGAERASAPVICRATAAKPKCPPRRACPSRQLYPDECRGGPHLSGDISMGRCSAIDQQGLSGDEAGGRRGEEDDRGRDVLRRPEPAQRRPGDLFLTERGVPPHPLARQIGLHQARADGIHRNAVGRKLEGKRTRQVD